MLEFTSHLSKKVIFTGREKWGKFYSGTRDETSGGTTWRPNPYLREGDFSTSLFTGRFDYNFSRRLLTSVLVQLESAARLSLINIRLCYIYLPESDFFIIYNLLTPSTRPMPGRQTTIRL
jgi:hypothetical protein